MADLPPPVGRSTSVSRPPTTDRIASAWPGSRPRCPRTSRAASRTFEGLPALSLPAARVRRPPGPAGPSLGDRVVADGLLGDGVAVEGDRIRPARVRLRVRCRRWRAEHDVPADLAGR